MGPHYEASESRVTESQLIVAGGKKGNIEALLAQKPETSDITGKMIRTLFCIFVLFSFALASFSDRLFPVHDQDVPLNSSLPPPQGQPHQRKERDSGR